MDVKLYDGYIAYRVAMGKSDETIFKEIAVLKTFLHWSVDREYNTNTKFIKQFKTFEKVKDVLSLTEEELFTIFKLPLTNKVHLQVRDMFCFACFTGLRYSDVLQVSPNKIIDSTLTLNQIKTTDKVTVQLVKFAVEILERNDYRFPQFSNFYVNKVLRKIAAEAKFERITSKLMISGKNRREEEKPLKDAISFHIGRKTYVTLSLKRGVRHEIVMSQTGHKDLKTLQKYIAVSNAMIAEELSQAWDKEPVKISI
jgi:integrase